MRKGSIILLIMILAAVCLRAQAEGTSLTAFLQEWYPGEVQTDAATDAATVVRDTDDVLIVSNPWPYDKNISEQFYFSREGEQWFLTSAIRYENNQNEDGCAEEYHSWIENGMLFTTWRLHDGNDNLLLESRICSMPDVLRKEERELSSIQWTQPNLPFTGAGYPTDENMQYANTLLERLFAAVVPSGYTYVDGIQEDGHLQFIADKAKGKRVLLCCAYGGSKAGWNVTESTPLPAKTTFGIENFTNHLNLGGKGYGPRIIRCHNGNWSAADMLAPHEIFLLGPCWAGDGLQYQEHKAGFGTSPWNDITTINWKNIPKTLKAAQKELCADGWATPNNPNANDRLHLRAKPNKNSTSLGKYYNGTPVRVLEKGKTWTKVRIGEQSGYMMTQYLAFDKKAWNVTAAGPVLFARNDVTDIYWDDAPAVPAKITAYEVDKLVVIGTDGESWYLMWDPITDHFGRIRQSALWEGNG